MPHPTVLAACALLGIDEVYAVGGAQAIAMFAYGAREDDGTVVCEPVNLVTGPGNIYVVAAKRLLKGLIGIDSEAGPTEIAVLADDSADPVPGRRRPDQPGRARPDGRLGPGHRRTRTSRTPSRPRSPTRSPRPSTPSGSAPRWPAASPAIVLVDDLDAGLAVCDAYAAEHLEIHTRDAAAVAARVRNAGAIFVGPYAPVSLGDYLAGSQPRAAHRWLRLPLQRAVGAVLPARRARRRVRPRRRSREVADHVVALADAEDLPGHGDAVRARARDRG